MAPSNNVTNQSQPKVWMDGQYKPASQDSNGKWYVISDNGVRVEVDKNDLFGMNSDLTSAPQRIASHYQELYEKSEEKKDYLEAMGSAIKARIKAVKGQYNEILASCGVKKYKDITDEAQQTQAREFYNDLTALEFQKIGNSNRYYSACMDSFDYALEQGNWENQVNLAKHSMGV